jgi:hypothetical protein
MKSRRVFQDVGLVQYIFSFISTLPCRKSSPAEEARKSTEEKLFDQFEFRNQEMIARKEIQTLRLVCKSWKRIIDNESFVIVEENEYASPQANKSPSVFQKMFTFLFGKDNDAPFSGNLASAKPFAPLSNQFWNSSTMGSNSLSNSKELDRWRNIDLVDDMYKSTLEQNGKKLRINISRSVPSLSSMNQGGLKEVISSEERQSEWDQSERIIFWETIVIPKWDIVKNSPYTKRIWRKFG